MISFELSDNILENISPPPIKKINHIFTFHENRYNNKFSSEDIITQAIYKVMNDKEIKKILKIFMNKQKNQALFIHQKILCTEQKPCELCSYFLILFNVRNIYGKYNMKK